VPRDPWEQRDGLDSRAHPVQQVHPGPRERLGVLEWAQREEQGPQGLLVYQVRQELAGLLEAMDRQAQQGIQEQRGPLDL